MEAFKRRRVDILVRCYSASRDRLLTALQQHNAGKATSEACSEARDDAKRYLLQLRLLVGWYKALDLIDASSVLEPDEIIPGR